ncbi:MAG: hypothetical protein B5M52_05615 [Helicobacteraceae bacterium 4484_230]|nr:MAG: hypothetical protein B5M52_05615 [Helicobacteraceae bacterium 4484_230]
MKKFFLVVWLMIPLISTASKTVDERIMDVYFGNGILTTEKEADEARSVVRKSILHDIYHDEEVAMQRNHGKEVKLAYNTTFKEAEIARIGKLGEVPGGILDIMESYEQLKNTSLGWNVFSTMLSVVTEIGLKRATLTKSVRKEIFDYFVDNYVSDYLATYISVQLTDSDLLRIKQLSKKALDDIIKKAHDTDLDRMVGDYEKSIESGHGVIMVTHSQGNLFAIEAVEKIKKNRPWMEKYFYQVSIASPATKFAAPEHVLISLDNDPVPYLSPLSVAYNNPARSYKHKAVSISPAVLGRKWYEFPPHIPGT